MSLIEKIKTDVSDALRAKDSQRAETLRGLVSSVHNEEIAKRSKGSDGELSDDEIISVLQREAKKRKESIEVYSKVGRSDLEDKERAELSVIESYLPEPLAEAEVESIVKNVIANGEDNFGKVMGATMKEVAGRADSKLVTEVVKRNLGGE